MPTILCRHITPVRGRICEAAHIRSGTVSLMAAVHRHRVVQRQALLRPRSPAVIFGRRGISSWSRRSRGTGVPAPVRRPSQVLLFARPRRRKLVLMGSKRSSEGSNVLYFSLPNGHADRVRENCGTSFICAAITAKQSSAAASRRFFCTNSTPPTGTTRSPAANVDDVVGSNKNSMDVVDHSPSNFPTRATDPQNHGHGDGDLPRAISSSSASAGPRSSCSSTAHHPSTNKNFWDRPSPMGPAEGSVKVVTASETRTMCRRTTNRRPPNGFGFESADLDVATCRPVDAAPQHDEPTVFGTHRGDHGGARQKVLLQRPSTFGAEEAPAGAPQHPHPAAPPTSLLGDSSTSSSSTGSSGQRTPAAPRAREQDFHARIQRILDQHGGFREEFRRSGGSTPTEETSRSPEQTQHQHQEHKGVGEGDAEVARKTKSDHHVTSLTMARRREENEERARDMVRQQRVERSKEKEARAAAREMKKRGKGSLGTAERSQDDIFGGDGEQFSWQDGQAQVDSSAATIPGRDNEAHQQESLQESESSSSSSSGSAATADVHDSTGATAFAATRSSTSAPDGGEIDPAHLASDVMRKVTDTATESFPRFEEPFVDKLWVTVRSGDGGEYEPGTRRRYTNHCGPAYGGHGADLWIKCTKHVGDLHEVLCGDQLAPRLKKGRNGTDGAGTERGRNQRGETLQVPIGTIVRERKLFYDPQTGEPFRTKDGRRVYLPEFLYQFLRHGDQIRVCKGGLGGVAPSSYKLHDGRKGGKGEKKLLELEYRVPCDVCLLGFPNSGKTALQAALTRAHTRIGPEPFSTTRPHTGVLKFRDGVEVRVTDLPSFLTGAAEEGNVGRRVLRHTYRARLLVFVVDMARKKDEGMTIGSAAVRVSSSTSSLLGPPASGEDRGSEGGEDGEVNKEKDFEGDVEDDYHPRHRRIADYIKRGDAVLAEKRPYLALPATSFSPEAANCNPSADDQDLGLLGLREGEQKSIMDALENTLAATVAAEAPEKVDADELTQNDDVDPQQMKEIPARGEAPSEPEDGTAHFFDEADGAINQEHDHETHWHGSQIVELHGRQSANDGQDRSSHKSTARTSTSTFTVSYSHEALDGFEQFLQLRREAVRYDPLNAEKPFLIVGTKCDRLHDDALFNLDSVYFRWQGRFARDGWATKAGGASAATPGDEHEVRAPGPTGGEAGEHQQPSPPPRHGGTRWTNSLSDVLGVSARFGLGIAPLARVIRSMLENDALEMRHREKIIGPMFPKAKLVEAHEPDPRIPLIAAGTEVFPRPDTSAPKNFQPKTIRGKGHRIFATY